jgi:hypothetical protein
MEMLESLKTLMVENKVPMPDFFDEGSTVNFDVPPTTPDPPSLIWKRVIPFTAVGMWSSTPTSRPPPGCRSCHALACK